MSVYASSLLLIREFVVPSLRISSSLRARNSVEGGITSVSHFSISCLSCPLGILSSSCCSVGGPSVRLDSRDDSCLWLSLDWMYARASKTVPSMMIETPVPNNFSCVGVCFVNS